MNTRGPYARSRQTQAKIARAALSIVREKGHKELTTAEVARRAGVSDAARFYHFPTRDHVLVAALYANDEETADMFSKLEDLDIAQVPLLTGVGESLDSPVGALFTALRAHAADREHPAHEYFFEHNRTTVTRLAEGIRQRQEASEAHPGLDPRSVARQLLAVWTGLVSQWQVDPSFELVDEIRRAFAHLTGRHAMQAKASIDQSMIDA